MKPTHSSTLLHTFFIFIASIPLILFAQLEQPITNSDVIFEEKEGLLAVEAEHFYKQSATSIRKWYRTSANEWPSVGEDPDGPHLVGASNNAYIEILPDTRTTHNDEIIGGINFINEPGEMAIVYYKVYIHQPGRYYVWVRTHSTGTEDNGVHVGIDGTWPEHGQRMQWTDKQKWHWDNKQRTQEVHTGVPMEIYLDIEEAGEHEIMFSMREDGFEFDKFILAKDPNFRPNQDAGPKVWIKSGELPVTFPLVKENPAYPADIFQTVLKAAKGLNLMKAQNFPFAGTNYYQDGLWLAINPNQAKEATASNKFPFKSGSYDMLFLAVGENDGQSSYEVMVNEKYIGSFTVPLSEYSFEEGVKYVDLWESISINQGDKITVNAKIGSADGSEFSRARWSGIAFAPIGMGKDVLEKLKTFSSKRNVGQAAQISLPQFTNAGEKIVPVKKVDPNFTFSDPANRKPDGDGSVEITGELKLWHKITLAMNGPFAHELDNEPNPFSDYRMTVTFTHESGTPSYEVPGYFAADGEAAESSADNGTIWSAHLSPDKAGIWNYEVSFLKGEYTAILDVPWAFSLKPYHGKKGSFEIKESDKSGRDFRAKGRLEYVGKHYLQFQGSKDFFFKAGADAPETLLAYEDFDGTYTVKRALKTWEPHLKDWHEGDPTWQNGKGKGLIGALNYLSEKGVNAFSFLTYNAGGDGDNVWPFVKREDKYHYDCSKLDQWQIVLDHAQSKGLHAHFKTQENENDDNRRGDHKGPIIESLDGGALGPQRRLYYRELIARYGYLLALNWNLGEENTQSEAERKAAAAYIAQTDPYPHNIVIHTFPNQQDDVYPAFLGTSSTLTGFSLQNHWDQVHKKTLKWVKATAENGKPLVIANDEQGSAATGVPPDPGYEGYKANELNYDLHDIRKQSLWANLMAGGAGVEYYFGYKLPQNDLICEDFRSRDKSWDYCRVAIDFFDNSGIPIWEMNNRNELIGNPKNEKEKFCLAKEGEVYVVYLAYTPSTTLDLTNADGKFSISWVNPRTGESALKGTVKKVKGGKVVKLGKAPKEQNEDWLVVVKRE